MLFQQFQQHHGCSYPQHQNTVGVKVCTYGGEEGGELLLYGNTVEVHFYPLHGMYTHKWCKQFPCRSHAVAYAYMLAARLTQGGNVCKLCTNTLGAEL